MHVARPLCLSMLMAAVLAGCAWWQPPLARQAVLGPYRIRASAGAPSGKLMLTDDGLWAFVQARAMERRAELDVGDLAAFRPSQSDHPAHLFAVLLKRSWGVVLERLDQRLVGGTGNVGTLVGIRSDGQFARWGLCRGEGARVVDHPCVSGADPSLAWRIFGADADGRVHVDPQWGLAPPIGADGMIHAGRAVVDSDAVRDGWIAVPVGAERHDIRHARVAVAPGCQQSGGVDVDTSSGLQPVDEIRGRVGRLDDAVDTETAAMRTGADVLVECSPEGVVTVSAPTLFRPLLEPSRSSASSSIAGIPFGAMQPIAIPPAASGARRPTIMLGAALATGSTLAADFYLERLLQAVPDSDLARHMAVDLMQVPVAASRPEAALRAGHKATSGAWNRQNNAGYVLGRAWVLAELGAPVSSAETSSRLNELSDRPKQHRLRAWLVWSKLRRRLRFGSSGDTHQALSYFDDHDMTRWLHLGRLLAGRNDRLAGAGSDPSLSADGLFDPSPISRANPSGAALDVYGRNFADAVQTYGVDHPAWLVDQLNTTALSAFRPGFGWTGLDKADFEPVAAITIRAALMPLLPETPSSPNPAADRAFGDLIGQIADTWRADGPCVQMGDTDRLVGRINAAASQRNPDGVLAATSWIVSKALPAACQSPEVFLSTLDAGADASPTVMAHVGALVEVLLSGVEADRRLHLVRSFAKMTVSPDESAPCKRWNLAAAASSASSGRIRQARRDLSRSINCQTDGQPDYADTEALLIGYLHFERTAEVSSQLDLDPSVRSKLDRLTRRQRSPTHPASSPCVGLMDMDYDLIGSIAPDIAALAAPMTNPPWDSLALQTSSKTVARGKSSLIVARRLLGGGRPRLAAKALMAARRSFSRIGHAGGIARTDFLEETVFGGHLREVADRADSAPPPVDLSHPDRLSARQWSAALRAGGARQILHALHGGRRANTAQAARAALAASMIVDSLEQAVEVWRAIRSKAPLKSLCETRPRR